MIDQVEHDGLFDDVHFDIALAHPMDICTTFVSDLIGIDRIVVYSPGAFMGSDTYYHHSGVPYIPSYMPHMVANLSDEMSFVDRLHNTAMSMLHGSNNFIAERWSPLRAQVNRIHTLYMRI